MILVDLHGYFPCVPNLNVISLFSHFHMMIKNFFGCSICILQTDGGGEYTSTRFLNYLLANGIVHHVSCPYTPQQNDHAERKQIIILLKPAYLCWQTVLSPNIIGWKPLTLLCISLTECPHKAFTGDPHIRSYLDTNPITIV